MSPTQDPSSKGPAQKSSDPEAQPHNFELQKELHQKIRNDPDYDDWEYGTEPLPQEAWLKQPSPSV